MNSLNKTLNIYINQILKLFQMKNLVYLVFMNLLFMPHIFADLTWQLPAQDVGTGSFNDNPEIVTSAIGDNVHVVWEDGAPFVFTSSSNNFGNNWSSAIALGSVSGFPQIATNDTGQYAYVVYRNFSSNFILFSRSIDFGENWTLGGSQITLSLATSTLPNIATDSTGKYVYAIWIYSTGNVVQFSRSIDFGENFPAAASATTLSDTTSIVTTLPKIVTSDRGQYVHAIWSGLKAPATINQVQASSSNDFGVTWTSFVNIPELSQSDFNASNLDLATDGQGKNVYAVWQKSIGGGTTIVQISRSNDFGATWTFEKTLSSTTAAVVSQTPKVVTDKTGKYVYVIWAQTGAEGVFVQIRRSINNGETFESADSISATNPSDTDITTDDLGRYVYAIWNDASNFIQESSRSFDFGLSFTLAQRVSPQGENSLAAPSITTSGSGIYAYSAFDRNGGSVLVALNGIDIPRAVRRFKFTKL
ncbi:MAG: hypothetical protein K1060chlam1_00702 [Candidatus Anoxychlamydiales bacterium]|nr:hypothetical protein [Candidatus Anoxychlamydiales bacterium]